MVRRWDAVQTLDQDSPSAKPTHQHHLQRGEPACLTAKSTMRPMIILMARSVLCVGFWKPSILTTRKRRYVDTCDSSLHAELKHMMLDDALGTLTTEMRIGTTEYMYITVKLQLFERAAKERPQAANQQAYNYDGAAQH
jgi:hypothetical protein